MIDFADQPQPEMTPRERIIAARDKRKQTLIAEVEQHRSAGRGRSAISITARRHADPRDLASVATLARKLRSIEPRLARLSAATDNGGKANSHYSRAQNRF